MLSHRVQGLAVIGIVFVVVVVVLTVVQAAKHDWFIFNGNFLETHGWHVLLHQAHELHCQPTLGTSDSCAIQSEQQPRKAPAVVLVDKISAVKAHMSEN